MLKIFIQELIIKQIWELIFCKQYYQQMFPETFSQEFFLKEFEKSQFECIFLTFGFIVLQMLVHFMKNQSGTKLGFTFYWFLCNGLWIHLYLDGIIGLLDHIPPLNYLYFLLDKRYSNKEQIVVNISTAEMIFMGPICILIAILCKTTQQGYKNVLIIVVSFVQFTGTCLFVHNEYSRDWKDVCPFGCFTFTGENITLFWVFFVAANPVWIFVPLWQISKAIKSLATSTKKQQKKD